MRKTGIFIISAILALVLVYCEKSEIVPNQPEKKVQQASVDNQRISFLKSSDATNNDYTGQLPFTLQYANQLSDTVIGFVVDYKAGDSYKLHEFDFVWDEKLVADNNGKLWMNLEIFHKTQEENANNFVSDSTQIQIPDLTAFDEETVSKLWFRFKNTTDANNILTLQYQKIVTNNQSGGDNGTGTTTQDSTQTGGENGSGTTTQDLTQTGWNNGSGTTIQDSTQTGRNDSTGTTAQDSTQTGWNTGSGTTIQDSSQTGSHP